MMKKKRGLLYGMLFLCLAGGVFCGWNLYQEWMPHVQAENTYSQVRAIAFAAAVQSDEETSDEAMRTERGHPDFDALSAWNPDIVGWLWAPGTDIDYPVVRGADNEYYLNHTADGTRSIIGSVFMESKNQKEFTDDVTVLYGHHIRGGRMFSSLSGYKNQSYYDAHPEMFLFTPEADYRIGIFAGQILDGQTGSFPLMFGGSEVRTDWLDHLLSVSTFQSGIYPEEDMRILALCTCTYEYDDARYAVYGVLKEIEE